MAPQNAQNDPKMDLGMEERKHLDSKIKHFEYRIKLGYGEYKKRVTLVSNFSDCAISHYTSTVRCVLCWCQKGTNI